jgi:hypothetical protein
MILDVWSGGGRFREVKEKCRGGWVDKGWQGKFLDIRNNCQLHRYPTARVASLYLDLSSIHPAHPPHLDLYIHIYIHNTAYREVYAVIPSQEAADSLGIFCIPRQN